MPRLRLLALVTVSLPLLGCRAVPVYHQHHVSKPGMRFTEKASLQYNATIISQLETGLAFSGGAQPTTCSACK